MKIKTGGREFSITCGECKEFVRRLPSLRFVPYMEKEYKNMAMPFGKYKGIIISTMIRNEEISYLIGMRGDDIWFRMDYHLKQCINRQIENYAFLKKEGKIDPDSEKRRKGVPMPDPLAEMKPYEKKFDPNDLPI